MNKGVSGFNFWATKYDKFRTLFFGSHILKAQRHFLNNISQANSILIFGGGTGEILLDCLKINNRAHYHYVDFSSEMIRLTKQRLARFTSDERIYQIDFLEGSASDITPECKFDTIITPFVLDCFNDISLQKIIESLNGHLKEGGMWLFSDFRYSDLSRLRYVISKIVIFVLYCLFNATCRINVWSLPSFEVLFLKNGLTPKKSAFLLKGMLQAQVYDKKYTNPH